MKIQNKETLFRGKRKDGGGWVYGYYLEKYEYVNRTQVNHYIILTSDGEEYEVIPDTVSECMGLICKLNKEKPKIFTGDIVVKHYEIIENETTVCTWSDIYSCFCFKNKTGETLFFQDCDSDKLELIGNIWDNPNLIN